MHILISAHPLIGKTYQSLMVILYKLYSVGIGSPALSILTLFRSNQSQHVMVDGSQSKLVIFVSGVSQLGHCFGPVIVSPGYLSAFFHSGAGY